QIAGRGVEVVLLLGARAPAELLYGDEFRAFAAAHPGFRFVPCFSRELPEPGSAHAHPDVRHGYVQQHLAEFAPDPAAD
ncbi:MAG TPA: ferredoxin--NADP reductase, partial [Pseudoxanthomonas sp.]|nr:ferredoxin--NADP reductase [Pseudoxanthomonas sp.]